MQHKVLTVREFKARASHYLNLIKEGYLFEVNGTLLGNMRSHAQTSVVTDSNLSAGDKQNSVVYSSVVTPNQGVVTDSNLSAGDKQNSVVPLSKDEYIPVDQEDYIEEEEKHDCQLCGTLRIFNELRLEYSDVSGDWYRVCFNCVFKSQGKRANEHWRRMQPYTGMMIPN